MPFSKHLACAMSLLALALSPVVAQAATGCALKKVAELPVTWQGAEQKTHIQVPGSIDGQALSVGFNVGSNTGALVDGKTAERFGWPIKTKTYTEFKPLGGVNTETLCYVDLGNLHLDMAEIAELDGLINTDTSDDAPHIDIGPQAIAGFDVEYDLAHDRIALYSRDHCPNQVVYWSNSWFETPFHPSRRGAIVFDVKVNDNVVEASLSPAFYFSTATPRLQSMIGIAGHARDPAFSIERLEFAGISMKNIRADSLDFQVEDLRNKTRYTGKTAEYDLTNFHLGLKEMKKFRIFVSHMDQKIFFTLPDDK